MLWKGRPSPNWQWDIWWEDSSDPVWSRDIFSPSRPGSACLAKPCRHFFDILGSSIGPKKCFKNVKECPRVWGALDKMSDLHLGVVGPRRKMSKKCRPVSGPKIKCQKMSGRTDTPNKMSKKCPTGLQPKIKCQKNVHRTSTPK